jgi:hypothetical protein
MKKGLRPAGQGCLQCSACLKLRPDEKGIKTARWSLVSRNNVWSWDLMKKGLRRKNKIHKGFYPDSMDGFEWAVLFSTQYPLTTHITEYRPARYHQTEMGGATPVGSDWRSLLLCEPTRSGWTRSGSFTLLLKLCRTDKTARLGLLAERMTASQRKKAQELPHECVKKDYKRCWASLNQRYADRTCFFWLIALSMIEFMLHHRCTTEIFHGF